jgi:pathogenesis-related protein 1
MRSRIGLASRGLAPRGLAPRGLAPRGLASRRLVLAGLALAGLALCLGCAPSAPTTPTGPTLPTAPTADVAGAPSAPGGWETPDEAAPGFAPRAPGESGPTEAAPQEDAADVAPGSPAAPELASPSGKKPARRPAPAAAGDAQALVDAHNRVRAKHCAPALTWSPKLAQVAQQWANALRDKGCAFGHSGGRYGENLAAGTSGVLDAEEVVKMWYDEISQYKFSGGGFSSQTGHFTQVVWRGTARIGCGRSQCKGMDIWVCEYDPAGNWEGQYRENVRPLGCR